MSIVVIGSSNTDMVIQSDKLPAPGETVLGGEFLMNPGGKGANQAVAAAKLGGEVHFVAKVGTDVFGEEAIRGFEAVGINTEHVSKDPDHASGVALILVDGKGENSISVALGANDHLTAEDLDAAQLAILGAKYVLVQLEIPLDTVLHLGKMLTDHDGKLILNPAPARALPESLLAQIDILTPNETEAELLTGIKVADVESAGQAARALHRKGVQTVIITMGKQGAFLSRENEQVLIPGKTVTAVDTTAAGDTFNGALCVALSEGKKLEEAIRFANHAAALSVTRMGAQASCPTKKELA
ncbi:MAG: ribokinase [Bacteroidota bacterium]